MIRLSTKLSVFTLLIALAGATSALADATPAGVAADVGAVQKDNADLNKDNADLARHRADKAQDKANGQYISQAVDSANIAKDKMKRGASENEKDSDQKTLNQDVNKAVTQ